MQEERRKRWRRRSDIEVRDYLRQLETRVQQMEAMVDCRGGADSEETERKRRRAIRHTCNVSIEMLIGHRSGLSEDWAIDAVKIKGRLLDLSASGASLYTKERFEPGQELRLGIQLPDESLIATRGAVRWVKALDNKDGFASGVQFGHLAEKDARNLRRFLKELDATAGL